MFRPFLQSVLLVAGAWFAHAASAQDQDIIFEAESGKVTAPYEVGRDGEASEGRYVYAPKSVPMAQERSQSKGQVVYEVEVPADGTYELWAKVFTPGKPRVREDSYYVSFAGRDLVWRVHDWADNWVWRRFTTEDVTENISFDLTKGKHRLVLGHRSSETMLDQLKLVPAGQADAFAGIDPSEIRAKDTQRYTNLSPYFDMPDLEVPNIPDRDFDVRDFGAKGDGTTMNTHAIADAIAAAVKAGGGRIVIPEGQWLTGPIHLKSNTELHVSKGATVLFSKNRDDYLPVVFSRWEGMELWNYSAPIYVYGATNVAITGEGLLNGQGEAWWEWKTTKQKEAAPALYQMVVDGVPPNERIFGDKFEGLRPSFVQFVSCRRVLIENVTFTNGPMWTIHPIYVNEMIVRGVKVKTVGPNNDGINPDSTQNILIEDSYFSTGDDCIVLKAGLNEDGWRVGRPTENVVIRRIYGNEGHGGIVVGSEMSGSVRNVYAHDSVFVGTDRGIRVKSMRGRGGVVENFWVERLRMKDMGGQAIRLNEFYGSSTVQPLTDVPPSFRNFTFRDIECDGAARAIEMIGLSEMPIRNITLENMRIKANQGFITTDSADITIRNVHIAPEKGPAFEIVRSHDITIAGSEQPTADAPFLVVRGKESSDITLSQVKLADTEKKAIAFEDSAKKSAVTVE
ncbi:MAG: glycoside hydrolase family 28 protein [Verrucomicrobiota bacterium JB022]|nr:glycoside hydrolase family 28 protein [Verrucomicrobiota bacterium JB022]